MKPVTRDQIMDYQTYTEKRDQIRQRALAAKENRRIHLGEHLTFLFENHDTVLYQIQEMMRVERIVKEADIAHEIKTYNELLGSEQELGCTLLIEIEDASDRDKKLKEWVGMMDYLEIVFDDGSTSKVKYDSRQIGDGRLSSVQYLKFPVNGHTPKGLRVSHPGYTAEVDFTEAQKQALLEDLGR